MMLFFGFLYGIPYAINATYMTESFPTSIRGSAVGGAYNIGKVLSIFFSINNWLSIAKRFYWLRTFGNGCGLFYLRGNSIVIY